MSIITIYPVKNWKANQFELKEAWRAGADFKSALGNGLGGTYLSIRDKEYLKSQGVTRIWIQSDKSAVSITL